MARPSGGSSEYLTGRQYGPVASVNAGRISFTRLIDVGVTEHFAGHNKLLFIIKTAPCVAKPGRRHRAGHRTGFAREDKSPRQSRQIDAIRHNETSAIETDSIRARIAVGAAIAGLQTVSHTPML